MTVKNVTKDPEALTMTLSVELEATPERVWQLWADPRQLERWWGPPTYPATVVDHDLVTGGHGTYFMTSPEGEKFHGWWEILSADPAAAPRAEGRLRRRQRRSQRLDAGDQHGDDARGD